jgi:hypothetical protein
MSGTEDDITITLRLSEWLRGAAEVKAARRMRDAILAYEMAEKRGMTSQAIAAFNAKELASRQYDAVREDNT